MTRLSNSLEGGTSGTTVSAGNSGGASGDAFNTVTIGTGATLAFDNAHAAHGTLGMQVATAGTTATSLAEYGITATVAWFRAYVFVTANPAANVNIIRLLDSATILTTVRLNSSGKIAFLTGAATLSGTSSATFPLNQWFRIEVGVDFTAPGSQTVTVRLYLGADPDSISITETISATALTVGSTNISTVRYGVITTGTNIGPFWLDDLAFSDVTWLGPVFSGQGAASSISTVTGAARAIDAVSGTAPSATTATGTATGLYTAAGTTVAITTASGDASRVPLTLAASGICPTVTTGLGNTTRTLLTLTASGTTDLSTTTIGSPTTLAGTDMMADSAGRVTATSAARGSASVVAGNDPFSQILERALACADAALSPPVARAALYPGGQVAWDNCDCGGQVWVRLISLVPSGNPINNQGRNLTTPCGVLMWTATIGVGVLRCAATVDDVGNAPTAAQLTADTVQMTTDLADLSAALQCCVAPQLNKLSMVRWDPLGPDGGCVGGEWQVTALVDNCRCP